MRSIRQGGSALALGLALVVLGGGDCEPNNDKLDAGSPPIDKTCQTDSDCDPGESCEVGLCLRRCSVHDVCDVGQFCSSTGYCESGCRTSDECESGKLCSRGSCVAGSGSCSTKADCPSGLVCRSQTCTEPPTTCTGPEDCPDDQLCNGFTQVCFDPTPAGCNNAGDCVGRAGCEAGCTCNASHECVVGASCTVATELQDCGVGGVCQGGGCIPQPGCNNQADCDSYGLYCNLSSRICERTSQCNDSAACASQAPATYCNMSAHRCEVPTCLNGGLTCTAPDECNAQGRCVPPAGASCSSNYQCCPDSATGCSAGVVEYCDIPAGQVSGSCRQGCRDNNDCTSPQTCNALNQCSTSTSTGTGGDGEPCNSLEDCRANYFCGALTKVCYEMCETPGATCPETGKTCQTVLFVNLCMEGGGGGMGFDAGGLSFDSGGLPLDAGSSD